MKSPLPDFAFQTASGRIVNPAMLQPEDIDLGDICEHLAKEARFNGATPGKFYSVAQHSLLVGHLVATSYSPESQGAYYYQLVLCALLHDAPEAYLRDLATPVKSQVGSAYLHMESRAWLAIARKFGLPPVMPAEVKRADLIALATEKLHLMPQSAGDQWACLDGVEPYQFGLLYDIFLWQEAAIELRERVEGFQRLLHQATTPAA